MELRSCNKGDNALDNLLVKTLTNELFQPMRLYYVIHNKTELIIYFKQLKCINHSSYLDNWMLMYTEEAAHIELKVSPNKIPKEARPLVIGALYIKDKKTLLIDVRSVERAEKIIEFVDRKIPRSIIEITHTAIYNKLVVASPNDPESVRDIDYDEIFDDQRMVVIDPEKTLQEMKAISEKYNDKSEVIKAIAQKSEEDFKKPLPEVEKFPIHFYEEGISGFRATCQFHQAIAVQHFLGNKDFSYYDLIQQVVYKNVDNDLMDEVTD
jgi:hypothetical protein